jgi:serine/threonine protein kinase
MRLAAGDRLGPYEVLALLGEGGMGEVYKARDTRLDRTVAIKVLPREFSTDPNRRARFQQEAKAIAALSHPHICALYDVGEQLLHPASRAPGVEGGAPDPVHYLVMEPSGDVTDRSVLDPDFTITIRSETPATCHRGCLVPPPDGLRHSRFALEALAELLVSHFDGDCAIEAGVAGFVHLAHAASADGGKDFVRTQAGTGGQRHNWSIVPHSRVRA